MWKDSPLHPKRDDRIMHTLEKDEDHYGRLALNCLTLRPCHDVSFVSCVPCPRGPFRWRSAV